MHNPLSEMFFKKSAVNLLVLGALGAISSSCQSDDLLEDGALADGETVSTVNRWQIPQSVMDISNPFQIQYDDVPTPGSPNLCPGQLLEGASTLKQILESEFTNAISVSGYDCELSSQGNRYTMHATGRALDIFLNIEEGPDRDEFGDNLANTMVVNSQDIGIQTVIWNRTIWNASRPTSPVNSRERPYVVLDQHRDHIHVELNNAASDMTTPFFQNNNDEDQPFPSTEPPSPNNPGNGESGSQSAEELFASLMPSDCEALPASGGIIDNGNPCMQLEGDPAQWNFSDSQGYQNKDYAWTRVSSSQNSSIAGVWYVRLNQPQNMVAEVYVPTSEQSHGQTNYVVETPNGSKAIVANLAGAPADGWVSLGELSLANDNFIKVKSFAENVQSSTFTIPVDALRLYPAGQRPSTTTPDTSDDVQDFRGGGCQSNNTNSNGWGFLSLMLLALLALPKRRFD